MVLLIFLISPKFSEGLLVLDGPLNFLISSEFWEGVPKWSGTFFRVFYH